MSRAEVGERAIAEVLVDQSSDALIALSQGGEVLFWSTGAERIFGYDRAAALGHPLEELIVPADRRWEARAALTEALETGGAVLETVRVRQDGSRVDVDVAMRTIRGSDGAIQFVAVNKTDVSALIRLRLARAAETRFRGLLEAAPDAMVIVSNRGRIVLVNGQTETMFRYARDELLGEPVEILVPERFRVQHPEHRTGYFHDAVPRPMGAGLDLFGRRKDGTEFPAEISLSPMDSDDGRVVIAAIRDISERKKAEVALRAANHELEAFSYSVAHDLRAPLRGMNGFAQLLLDNYQERLDGEAHDWLHEILSNARRMGALIDALLSLSRVARIELQREWIDLTAIARASAAQLAAADPGHAPVEVSIAEGLYADADPNLARTVLDNLLSNAWKFTGHAPAPRIAVGATDGDARSFFVRDNGAGFDMEFADKLFAPFQRLHTVTEFPGTGIGLASVHRILQRHGGRIWAEARIGEGATFYFTFTGPSPGGES